MRRRTPGRLTREPAPLLPEMGSAAQVQQTGVRQFRCGLETCSRTPHLCWTRGTAPPAAPAPLTSNAVRLRRGSSTSRPQATTPAEQRCCSGLVPHRAPARAQGRAAAAPLLAPRRPGTAHPALCRPPSANPSPASGGTGGGRRRGHPAPPGTPRPAPHRPRSTRHRRGTGLRRASWLTRSDHARQPCTALVPGGPAPWPSGRLQAEPPRGGPAGRTGAPPQAWQLQP
jgi:hypothetical protein